MVIAIIPARFASSRFPGKPLALINGKPMIQMVMENTVKSNRINSAYVATDDEKIFKTVKDLGFNVLMTSDKHRSGSERITECIDLLGLDDDDIVLNIQGDEPLVSPGLIEDLISCFDDPNVYMGTLKRKIENRNELDDPNVVKVVTGADGYAMYFSRFCIPYERDHYHINHFKHIGMYGYKVWFLRKFKNLPPDEAEQSESLEQLRVLGNGFKIKVVETKFDTVGVDTPEDLKNVERILGEKRE